MAYSTYFLVRQILMGILLFLGGNMLLVSLPERLYGSFYHKSMRTMGFAFLFVPLSCFVYTPTNRLDLQPYISTAISLTAYYATFIMMAVSFLILLGKKLGKTVMGIIITTVVLYPVPLWISIFSGRPETIDTVVSASYSFFVIMIIVLAIYILHNHRVALDNINNYYSDDIKICVDWISGSMRMLIGLVIVCIFAPLFFTYPRWLRFVFMVYGVLCYLQIHYGYRRMLINIAENGLMHNHGISSLASVQQASDKEFIVSQEVESSIKTNLEAWLLKKDYLSRGFSINDVAKSIGTNRTYLSKYINTTYQCSFRVWITRLRLEEAKRLLSDRPAMQIDDISRTVGAASLESFTHIFTRVEGVSPAKWRQEHSN